MNDQRKEASGRNTQIFLYLMANRIGVIVDYGDGTDGLNVFVKSWDAASPFADHGVDQVFFSTGGLTTKADIQAAALTAINTFASNNGFTFSSLIKGLDGSFPTGLTAAPQAAIADAPADATTNYNTITTLLGALTGAVNTANSKQNDIATKLNALLSELRTLGLIST